MRTMGARGLEKWAAGLSFGAGIVHGAAGPEHFAEWWAYGVFFYAAAAAQVGYGIILATQGIEGWGGWAVVRRKVYLLGIIGNLAIIALWVVSRTVGVPVGPEAGEPEPVGFLDGVSKVLEFALIAVLVRLRSTVPVAKLSAASL